MRPTIVMVSIVGLPATAVAWQQAGTAAPGMGVTLRAPPDRSRRALPCTQRSYIINKRREHLLILRTVVWRFCLWGLLLGADVGVIYSTVLSAPAMLADARLSAPVNVAAVVGSVALVAAYGVLVGGAVGLIGGMVNGVAVGVSLQRQRGRPEGIRRIVRIVAVINGFALLLPAVTGWLTLPALAAWLGIIWTTRRVVRECVDSFAD